LDKVFASTLRFLTLQFITLSPFSQGIVKIPLTANLY
jgi:hypothetical protein